MFGGRRRGTAVALGLLLLFAVAVGAGALIAARIRSSSQPSPGNTPSARTGAAPAPNVTASPGNTPSAGAGAARNGTTATVTCINQTAYDTAALTSAIGTATGTVQIAAGTCALDARLPIHKALTISGAGPTATFLVQHAAVNIFQITAPSVTVENLNLDSVTFNPGAGTLKHPKPGVLFSAQSHTTILNVTAEAGSGFAIRLVGPQPCTGDSTTGTVVDNVNITSSGHGGFASLDISCTNGAQLSNITIHGDILAMFKDMNVTLNGETYTPNNRTCQPPFYVTGPASNITIAGVTSAGGKGIVKGTTSNIVVTNQTANPACP